MQIEPANSAATHAGMDSLRGKTAIITGSTSGIGLGIAQAFAARGASILLNGFGNQAENEAIAARISQDFSVKTIFSPADMSKAGEIAEMIDTANKAFGQIDIVVNNAGIQHVEAVETFPPEKWEAIIAINLTAAFHTTRAVIPQMKARRWGRIINVASAHALVASPFKSAYVASKHGVLGFTKTVALECAEFGITVNALCPGYVLTPLVQKQIPETAKARGITETQVINDVLLHAQPTHEFVTTEQLGAVAVFLCSDAAKSITGIALPVDGGWTAQ